MSANDDYQKLYKAQLEESLLYQDFVVDCCFNLLKLPLSIYSSRFYQQKFGESVNGAEIKHDKEYKRTGNLWIEFGEKASLRDGPYFPSGILRKDNTWLYIIGDYDTIFIFGKKALQSLHAAGQYQRRENGTKTSEGFLLPKVDASGLAAQILCPKSSEKIRKDAEELAHIGRVVKRSMTMAQSTGTQLTLPLELTD